VTLFRPSFRLKFFLLSTRLNSYAIALSESSRLPAERPQSLLAAQPLCSADVTLPQRYYGPIRLPNPATDGLLFPRRCCLAALTLPPSTLSGIPD